jgi:hypothetical protein
MRAVVALVLSCALVSCGADPGEEGVGLRRSAARRGSSSSSSSGNAGEGSSLAGTGDGFHELCWSTINAYRAREGLPPYERWVDGEACADGQSEDDATSNRPHGSFPRCKEMAQNECPGTPGRAEDAIIDCLAAMWREGPGGGHHDAMASTKYTKVACGVFETSRGTTWSVQNFR